MANKLMLKRGTKAKLPALSVGEPAFTTDTKELFVGATGGNVQIPNMTQLGNLATVATHSKAGTVHSLTLAAKATTGIQLAQFKATADYTEGNTWKVGGVVYTAKLQGEEGALPNKLFVVGDMVSVMLDPVGKKLGFKSGGSSIAISAKAMLPTIAVNNSVVIITDLSISKFVLSPDEPQAPTNGIAWVNSSLGEFILITGTSKKIKTKLGQARVFYNGTWANVDAYFGQNDVWNQISHTYRVMTVRIDLANSSPETCCTYADDAIGIIPGSEEWDEFFGHYPVILKDGIEVGKLDRNNFAQFEDGVAADITSGNAGDVMIAFPRRGVKITTIGNILKVSMTDDPDNPDFEYYAHTRITRKEKFYIGAYKGHILSLKLRSLSGKTPTASQTIGTFRTRARANGTGYEQSGFYQLLFRQAMYLLKYKNLDSQTAVGRGYVDGNAAAVNTGGAETKGMDWGETTGKQHVKLFGIEDFWGNVWECIDGIVTNSTQNTLTATTGFNDSGAGYTDRGKIVAPGGIGFISKPQGTTQTGFVVKEFNGSATTYFCDTVVWSGPYVVRFGSGWDGGDGSGAFVLVANNASSSHYPVVGGRLMYLKEET